jgi:hypothetical protein
MSIITNPKSSDASCEHEFRMHSNEGNYWEACKECGCLNKFLSEVGELEAKK